MWLKIAQEKNSTIVKDCINIYKKWAEKDTEPLDRYMNQSDFHSKNGLFIITGVGRTEVPTRISLSRKPPSLQTGGSSPMSYL